MKIIDSKFIAANVAANATHGGNTLPPQICWINRAVIETQTHVCFMDFQNLISGEVGIRASWMEKFSEINKRGGDYSIPLEYHLKDFKKLYKGHLRRLWGVGVKKYKLGLYESTHTHLTAISEKQRLYTLITLQEIIQIT